MSYHANTNRPRTMMMHLVLMLYTVIALGPMLLVFTGAFNTRRGIFSDPLRLPTAENFSVTGFQEVLYQPQFDIFFFNSMVVSVISICLILLFGMMIAWTLIKYRFNRSLLVGVLCAMGMMIPIRLGSVSPVEIMVSMELVNTLWALIFVYVAQGLPLAVYILFEFIRTVPNDLKEAARCDGVSEYLILFAIIMPLIRPALAAVAVFSMIPIWNDLWFPLILAPSEATQAMTLGVQEFIGQFVTDWNAVLASLTLAIVPVVILYLIFSRQLVRGLMPGAIK